jgi:cobalamin-dependent methionine synthase I
LVQEKCFLQVVNLLVCIEESGSFLLPFIEAEKMVFRVLQVLILMATVKGDVRYWKKYCFSCFGL